MLENKRVVKAGLKCPHDEYELLYGQYETFRSGFLSDCGCREVQNCDKYPLYSSRASKQGSSLTEDDWKVPSE